MRWMRHQSRMVAAIGSRPLSQRMHSGEPRRIRPSSSAPTTSSAVTERPTRRARFSRMNSSHLDSPLSGRPSAVESPPLASAPAAAAAGWFGSARSPDTPFAQRPGSAASGAAPPLAGGPGSIVSPHHLLQHLIVQRPGVVATSATLFPSASKRSPPLSACAPPTPVCVPASPWFPLPPFGCGGTFISGGPVHGGQPHPPSPRPTPLLRDSLTSTFIGGST